jgi:AcrR family transcriptional regulator
LTPLLNPVASFEREFRLDRNIGVGLCDVQEERMGAVRQKPGKDRHQEILDAAARVITERGLAETRISDIAEQAGVSPGLILYYFESKDRLLAEALTFANDQFYLRTSRESRCAA